MGIFMEEIQRAATGPAAEKKFRASGPVAPAPAGPPVAAAAAPASASASAVAVAPQHERLARAQAVDKLPDVYDLFDKEGLPISRASVQQFALSQKLRELKDTPGGVWIKARWRPEFGGYEIVALAT
jgi:hypothetical protein